MIEHGYGQAASVQQLFKQYGYKKVATHQDLAGNDRVTIGYFK
jgi:release factor glutamine methyltransferase